MNRGQQAIEADHLQPHNAVENEEDETILARVGFADEIELARQDQPFAAVGEKAVIDGKFQRPASAIRMNSQRKMPLRSDASASAFQPESFVLRRNKPKSSAVRKPPVYDALKGVVMEARGGMGV
jgi:hypothetical protein